MALKMDDEWSFVSAGNDRAGVSWWRVSTGGAALGICRIKGGLMHTFEWDGHLETGNELIDKEHKQIVDIYNDCIELALNKVDKRQLDARLNELLAKLAEHFRTEEILAGCILASEAGKLKLAEHKARHDQMLDYLSTAIPELAEQEGNTLAIQELFDRIHEWYETHIENEDKEFVAYMKRRFAS
jgi:hemerythrin